jgi:tRNA-intron endonuclease
MDVIKAYITGEIISSNFSEAYSLYEKSGFGEPSKSKDKIQYSLPEALFLVERKKLIVLNSKGKEILFKELMDMFKRIDKKIQIKYPVFRDLREKGYIVKTALKFGADYRIYEKGHKVGEQHAKWVCFVDHESNKLTWHEFSAKNRVAHSTKKNLLIGIVDEEEDVTYYNISWIKP